jgi:hypothetical protein
MVLVTQLLLNLQSKHFIFVVVVVVVETPHRLGLKICIADCDEKNLAQVGQELTAIIGQSNVLVIPTDVSKLDQVVKLRDRVYETWGEVRICSACVVPLFLGSLANLRCRRSRQYVCFSRVLLVSDLFLGPCS